MGSAQSTLSLTSDQQVKIFRQLYAEHELLLKTNSEDKAALYDALNAKFDQLSEVSLLSSSVDTSKESLTCPKV